MKAASDGTFISLVAVRVLNMHIQIHTLKHLTFPLGGVYAGRPTNQRKAAPFALSMGYRHREG